MFTIILTCCYDEYKYSILNIDKEQEFGVVQSYGIGIDDCLDNKCVINP